MNRTQFYVFCMSPKFYLIKPLQVLADLHSVKILSFELVCLNKVLSKNVNYAGSREIQKKLLVDTKIKKAGKSKTFNFIDKPLKCFV